MITAIIFLCLLIGLIKWLKTDREYKKTQINSMNRGPQQDEEEPNDTEYTVRIRRDKKLNRVQWNGDGDWLYWEDYREPGYIPQTYEYSHKKRDGVDYLVVIEES